MSSPTDLPKRRGRRTNEANEEHSQTSRASSVLSTKHSPFAAEVQNEDSPRTNPRFESGFINFDFQSSHAFLEVSGMRASVEGSSAMLNVAARTPESKNEKPERCGVFQANRRTKQSPRTSPLHKPLVFCALPNVLIGGLFLHSSKPIGFPPNAAMTIGCGYIKATAREHRTG